MRKVKYRIYYKKYNQMILPFGQDELNPIVLGMNGEVYKAEDEDIRSNTAKALQLFGPEDIVVMFCTGRKDKNGQEIFEADMLRNHTGYVENPIRWSNLHSGFTWDKDDEGEGGFSTWKREVIGNIYENPDLLDK